jgi:mannose-1-phosphate guanylyltransferase
MRYGMIMAGGSGTRLWPMSRAGRPKQLLPFMPAPGGGGYTSLLALAAGRLHGMVPPERRYICTSEGFRSIIKAELPEFSDDRILGEPVGRDTVNAVGFAAAAFHKLDKDAVFAVLTADHLIEPQETFLKCIDVGFKLVESDPRRFVTFSIRPTYAATGFGYCERGAAIGGVPGGEGIAFQVARFVEKPNLQRAQAYVESGQFGWNSGMFIFKAATFLDCLKRYKPESFEGVVKIASALGTRDQAKTIAEVYPTLPKISVDFAVMEPASQDKSGSVSIATVLMDVKWLDVGSWPSYGETLGADEDGNRRGGAGGSAAILRGCRNTLVVNDDPGHVVAVLGTDDLIVVRTKEATLVMPRAKAEELKALHAQVPERLK